MNQPDVFSATLGLYGPWKVVSVSFAKEENRLDINIDFTDGSVFTCPECGSDGTVCDVENEKWYHDNFFQYETYLHARVPRIRCCSGIFPVVRPWSRTGSKFVMRDEG